MEENAPLSEDPAGLVDDPMLETSENTERAVEIAASVNSPVQTTSEDVIEKSPESGEIPQRVSNIKRIVSPEEIQLIKSVYCSGLPEELSNKEQIKEYFSEFGEVVRVYMSQKKMACTVHYKDHKSAANAKKYGGVYDNKRFHIFWSQSSMSKTAKSPPSAKREEKKTHATEREKKLKDTTVECERKLSLRSSARRKTSESSSPQRKVSESKPSKSSRSMTSKGKGKSELALSVVDVDVVFSKNATSKDLKEVLKIPAKSAEEKYRVLEARDKLMRMERVKNLKLGVAGRLHGTCPDMCPEKERYLRESQHQIHPYELKPTKEYSMNHAAAIKQYSRSSADQEEPLPHELRPSKVLMMAMNYMVCNILDLSEKKEENLRDWYFYVWDRTRAIRKDITQQQLCDMDSVLLVEQCARFHIHCAERLVSEDVTVFDEKINNENLTKCLQTLKHLYHDMAMKGEFCPNEAEFRGYIILMNLGDGNFMWEVQDLRPEIQQSNPVRFAVQVYFALSSGNYVRFFKLVKSAAYLNACLMHRYFNQVRTKALAAIARSYSFQSKIAQFPICNLVNLLNFESTAQGEMFCEHYGVELDSSRKFLCLGRNTLPPPSSVFPQTRAFNVIESKRTCSIGEVIVGGQISESMFKEHMPHTSFNEAGLLRNEAWNALDQEESRTVPVVDVIPVAPAELEVNKEALIQEISVSLLEEMIKETVHQEVRDVSDKMMDYVNKLSVAFQSMYCETFVREFVRDLCSATLKEMKIEKLKEEREAQKTRKIYEELIEKSSNEIAVSLVAEEIDNLCKSEASSVLREEKEKHIAAKEIMMEILNEKTENMVEEIANELISFEHEERTRKLEALSKTVKRNMRRYYFNSFLKAYEKKKLLKISMQGFPAWMSSMTLDEQVKWFGTSPHTEVSLKRRWSTAFESGNNISTQTYPLVNFENIIMKSLLKSIRNSGSLKNEQECLLKWNVVLSVPEIWNESKDVNPVPQWIDRCFLSDPLKYSKDKHLYQSETKLNEHVSLGINIKKMVGNYSADKICHEISGLLFILQGDKDKANDDFMRLIEIINHNMKYQSCSLAVLVIGFSTHELLYQLNLDSLVKRNLITKYHIFFHNKSTREFPHVQMEHALNWLAQNSEFPPPLEIKSLKTIMWQLLLEEFWVSLILRAKENEMFQLILEDPNDLISIYNEVVHILADQCCNRNYLNLHGISDSQVEFRNEQYLSIYKNLPTHRFKSHHLLKMKQLVESATLPKIPSLPAQDFEELSIILKDYCSLISHNHKTAMKAYTVVMQILEQDFFCKNTWKSTYRKSFSSPWPSILKVLSEIHVQSINFGGERNDFSASIIINNEIKRMFESNGIHWWRKISTIPALIEKIQDETSKELSMQSLEDSHEKEEKEPEGSSLRNLKDRLDRITEALSKQSSQLAILNSEIEDSINIGNSY